MSIKFPVLLLLSTLSFAQANTKIGFTVAAPGQPNLTSSDFSVSVNGKTVPVIAPAAAAAPAATPKADDLSTVPPQPIVSPIIFVFDVMETRAADERDTRKIALRYMASAAARNESVGLVLLTQNGLKVVHDYRLGSAVLAAALDGVNGKATPVSGADRVLAEETRRLADFAKGGDANAAPSSQNLPVNIEGPTFMMSDIAASLAGVPGRKAVVWITNGVPFEILDNDHSVTSHYEGNSGPAVAGMRVTVNKRYMNDDQIRKLQPDWRVAMDNLFESGTAVYPVEARGAFSNPPGGVLTSTMDSLARMTGGRASYGSNDPTAFFASIAAENATAYALSFTVDPGRGDWQKLTVSSARAPKLIAAPGFFPPVGTPADARKRTVNQAILSPMSYAALPFNLVLGEQTANGAKKSVKFSVFLPPTAGIADMKAGEVNIDIAAIALTATGAHAGTVVAAAGGKLPPEALQQISEMGVNITKSIDVAPGEYTLRVVVRDNLTGRIGSVNAILRVQ